MERILIIDDESQIRSMIRLILEREGYAVMEASDGIEGLRLFREKPADLVITDLIMPNKDGIGMIIEIKKEFPNVKIVAMSGGGLNRPEGYLLGAQKLGASCTLAKPINRQELLRAVKDTLKRNLDASSV
jgi:DNA-binding response OmpR family regulator